MGSVSIRNVRKSYGAVEVLHGVSIDIARRRVRRAGRAVGLRQVDAAAHARRARGDHRAARSPSTAGWSTRCAPKERDIAMVFQSYALYPHMTVEREHGLLAEAAPGRRRTRSERASARRRRMLGLEPYLERYPRQLSGGQRQRVAMGRAMVRDAEGLPVRRAAVEPRRQAARADALGDQAEPPAAEDDDGLRHARPDRGDDHGRPHRRHARRRGRAGRHAARALRPSGQSVRRRLHRLAGDEHAGRHGRGRRRSSPSDGTGIALPAQRPRSTAEVRRSASGRSISASTRTGLPPRSSPSSRPARRRRWHAAGRPGRGRRLPRAHQRAAGRDAARQPGSRARCICSIRKTGQRIAA